MERRDEAVTSRGDAASIPGRALPFGVLVLDEQGTVLSYDRAEEKRDDRRLDDIEGKNFFTEVTPCTNVAAFGRNFAEEVKRTGEIAQFVYRFPFPNGKRVVRILMIAFRFKGTPRCLVVTGDLKERIF